MASIRFRHSLANLLVGAALLAAPVASFGRDPVPPFSSQHAPKEPEDNVVTDASAATFDDTVKWLTENLLKNGSSRYTNVVSVNGVRMPLKTSETIVGAAVKADVLELKILATYAGNGLAYTDVSESLSIPLRLIKRVSAIDGDPGAPASTSTRAQLTYITITISCAHSDIADRATTKTMPSAGSVPETSDSTDILKELNLHIDQNFDYCQRIEKAIRHLARLARAMPPSNPAEPFEFG